MENSITALIEKTRCIGTWSLDVVESVAAWSPATYAIHEENPSKRIHLKDGLNYYTPEHRPIIEKCVQSSIDDQEPWDVELQICTAKGRRRWVRSIGEPVFENGQLTKLQGVFEDIDERKSLEVEREELLGRVMQGERIARLGHWWWHDSPESLQWTPGTYHLHGLPEDHAPPTKDEYLELVHPEDRDGLLRTKQQAFEDERSFAVEYRLRTDGRDKYIRSEGLPRHNAAGQLSGFVGVTIDRTQEVEAQIRNEELNRRLTLAMEASQIGVWEWNIVTNELIWDLHMYRLYGIDEAAFSGAYEAWERGLHPDDKQDAVEKIQYALAKREKFDATFRVVWPDGTVRTIQGIGDAVLDAAGEPQRLIGVNWDITDRVSAERELERSNEELAQFAYRTSHDLKSPLTAIRRLAAYMREDLNEGSLDEVDLNLSAIELRTGAMEEMVVGILNTAKADLSHSDPEPINLEEIMDEIAESLQFLSEDKRVEISWTVRNSEWPTLTRVRVYQILTNLVANGIKYSSPDREQRFVRVEASCSDDRLVMVVEDNGIGIPSPDTETPYEMFTRFSANASGSGLGLYIVKKHVEALDGTIRFDSSPAGTRFELGFPTHSSPIPHAVA